ncbi:hypothetical protein BZG36_03242 [Bifiguratus adelaidae]|uniref:Uncharacterized protein n=1 Tax=Bifiguratus adelaidae TaxID=1938954 RepID=A0A261Y042_9FUNG|nr:hypothetical protein BZG36_03242 [Bifiguratus adelaidae]
MKASFLALVLAQAAVLVSSQTPTLSGPRCDATCTSTPTPCPSDCPDTCVYPTTSGCCKSGTPTCPVDLTPHASQTLPIIQPSGGATAASQTLPIMTTGASVIGVSTFSPMSSMSSSMASSGSARGSASASSSASAGVRIQEQGGLVSLVLTGAAAFGLAVLLM